MRILIVEDENRIAKRILRMTTSFFGKKIDSIVHHDALDEALNYLKVNEIDLLLLDLNLNGENGFEVLKNIAASAFHTIIVSAYQEKAITAFEYGVLDFVPKPFNEERLHKAFLRISNKKNIISNGAKYLAVQKRGSLHLLEVENICYIKGAGIYTELHFRNGSQEIHNKSLDKLEQLLPERFERIHKSYLLDMTEAKQFFVESGSKYSVLLQNEEQLPIGRTRYKYLKTKYLR